MGLGVDDHGHHTRKERIFTDSRNADRQLSVAVDGTADDPIADRFFLGDRFAGDHSFLDKTASRFNHSIERDGLSLVDGESIPEGDL